MSLAPITLTTDKSTATIENNHRKLRQDESGLSITVTVLNEDNTPYNLTEKNLVFCENKQNNKIIIDNGKGDNSGKFNRNSDNDTKGVFTYVLQEDVYAASGKAWFEIDDGTTVDSTKNFYFDVEKDASVSVSNNDYVGPLKALETAMAGAQGKITSDLADMEAQIIKQITNGQSLIKNAESSTQSSIDSLTGKINQAISNGQKDVANSLAETKAANDRKIIQAVKDLTDQTTAALSNVDEYTQKLATLQSQWDSELQSIKNKAGTDTDSAVKAINDRYTNDFNQIKSDFANWQNSTTKNYQKQVNDILSKVQANGAEVSDVQKQVNDTIAQMQTLTKQFSKIDFTKFVKPSDLDAIKYAPQERRELGANDDANDIVDDGIYRISSSPIKNGNGENYCFLCVKRWDDNSVYQKLRCWDGIFIRRISQQNKTYPGWQKIATSDDVTALQGEVASQGTAIGKLNKLSGGVNLFRNTNKLDQFWKVLPQGSDSHGNAEEAATHATDVNHELVETESVFHTWGTQAMDVGLETTQPIYFEPGSYTISFLARNDGTDVSSFNLQLYSDYTDKHGGTPIGTTSTELTNTWQQYSITFNIAEAGTYGNWRLANWSIAPIPGGSLFFANLKLEHGAVATDWCPNYEDYYYALNNKADKTDVAALQGRVTSLEGKQYITHVAHESDVASQTAPIVIVDD